MQSCQIEKSLRLVANCRIKNTDMEKRLILYGCIRPDSTVIFENILKEPKKSGIASLGKLVTFESGNF